MSWHAFTVFSADLLFIISMSNLLDIFDARLCFSTFWNLAQWEEQSLFTNTSSTVSLSRSRQLFEKEHQEILIHLQCQIFQWGDLQATGHLPHTDLTLAHWNSSSRQLFILTALGVIWVELYLYFCSSHLYCELCMLGGHGSIKTHQIGYINHPCPCRGGGDGSHPMCLSVWMTICLLPLYCPHHYPTLQ